MTLCWVRVNLSIQRLMFVGTSYLSRYILFFVRSLVGKDNVFVVTSLFHHDIASQKNVIMKTFYTGERETLIFDMGRVHL